MAKSPRAPGVGVCRVPQERGLDVAFCDDLGLRPGTGLGSMPLR